MPDRPLRCHRCRSANLTLNEVVHEHASFSSLVLDEEGNIEALDEAVFEAGEIQPNLTRVHCHDCGHGWHPRRAFRGYRT